MRVVQAVVALAALAVAKPLPQGVTASISPSEAVPSGCSVNHAGYFGLAVQTIGSTKKNKLRPIINARTAKQPPQRPVSTISDGQVQAPTDTANGGTPTGNKPTSGGVPTGSGPTSGGTTTGSKPPNGGTKTGSIPTSSGNGGSSNTAPGSTSTSWVTVTSTISIQCSTSNVSIICSTLTPESHETCSMAATSTVEISSGEMSTLSTYTWSPSATTTVTSETLTSARSTIVTGSFSNTTNQLTNATLQTPMTTTTTMVPVSQISDGQVQATITSSPAPPPAVSTTTMDPVTTIPDGQVQATHTAKVARDLVADMVERAVGFWRSEESDIQANTKPVACRTNSTLVIQLHHGALRDHTGRTGYIASNYQFQFDAPPQAGALYTAGFSLCKDGTLALGNSTTFYRCLSGDFYNLYDRYWAPQCEAIELVLVNLEDC